MNVVSMFNDFTLPSGPAKYEELCALHRLVASILADDLNSIEEDTYEGDESAKVEIIKVAIRFLNNNKIKVDKDSSVKSFAAQLSSLNLPSREEMEA